MVWYFVSFRFPQNDGTTYCGKLIVYFLWYFFSTIYVLLKQKKPQHFKIFLTMNQ
jgi:hypothetical protein